MQRCERIAPEADLVTDLSIASLAFALHQQIPFLLQGWWAQAHCIEKCESTWEKPVDTFWISSHVCWCPRKPEKQKLGLKTLVPYIHNFEKRLFYCRNGRIFAVLPNCQFLQQFFFLRTVACLVSKDAKFHGNCYDNSEIVKIRLLTNQNIHLL